MDKTDARALLKKFLAGQCTEEEAAMLEEWYQKSEGTSVPQHLLDEQLEEVWQRLPIHEVPVRRSRFWVPIAAAAAILISLAVGLVLYMKREPARPQLVLNRPARIVPGGNRAILTLGNGQTVDLNDAQIGDIAVDVGIQIRKTKEGKIVYEVNESGSSAITTNTIQTPRGGQYQVVLPDGSKVWLNAATKLSFPSSFSGASERVVQLTGEAYFEIAHNAQKPFRVETADHEVEVLGTHFNVLAYPDDEYTRTTLLEGSVRLSATGHRAVLKVGEQGYFDPQRKQLKIAAVNTADAIAWKNGFFVFDRANIKQLMGQISRWYDVTVKYETQRSSDVFFGKIDRNAELKDVLKILELGGVHFRIEGRTLIVTN